MSIKAVLFDMGNVLIEISFLKMMRSFGKEFKSEKDAATFVEAWKFHDQYERGNISTDEFHQNINSALNLKLNFEELKSSWNDIYVKETDGINELLNQLKNRFPLYLLSNTNIIHMDYCKQHFAVLNHFQHKFFSYDLRARKPELVIFESVTKVIGHKPHEILFFDDLPKNVENARLFGMKAEIAFQSTEAVRAGLALHGIS